MNESSCGCCGCTIREGAPPVLIMNPVEMKVGSSVCVWSECQQGAASEPMAKRADGK